MYTMGRDREKLLIASCWYRSINSPLHFRIIDAFHDWHARQATVSEAVHCVLGVVDAKPIRQVLETAVYWYWQVVEEEPRFCLLRDQLLAHSKAFVRVFAVDDFLIEPNSDETRLQYVGLLRDRAKSVRVAAVLGAYYGRWTRVFDLLEQAVREACSDERQFIEERVAFIKAGYRVDEGGHRVSYYSGAGRGGAGSISNAPLSDVSLGLLKRLEAEEWRYLNREGDWPLRPKDYKFDVARRLENWSPNPLPN